ncbi:MAG: hypothetical protein WA621_00770 [Candidatus Acidiferrum sp.]
MRLLLFLVFPPSYQTGATTATSGTYCYQFGYDAWANLLSQAGWSPNYNGRSEATMGAVTANGNNQLPGFTYDASGNTQNDGTIAYTYNGESQMVTADGRVAQRLGRRRNLCSWF